MDQNDITQSTSSEFVVYAGFWPRIVALLIDGIILIPITIPLTIFNIDNWKNLPLFIFTSLIGVCYKPLLEYKYGATFGKMVLGIKVVNKAYQKANMKEVLLRNIFHLIPTIFSMIVGVFIFLKPEFLEISSFTEYTSLTQDSYLSLFSGKMTGLICIIDVIFLLSDKQKRALHDRIGQTYVIVQEK